MKYYELVGIENRQSKNGTSYHMLHLVQDFTDPKYGVGKRCSVEYLSNKYYPDEGLHVGDIVELTYGRSFDGKAYINGVHSVEIPTVKK